MAEPFAPELVIDPTSEDVVAEVREFTRRPRGGQRHLRQPGGRHPSPGRGAGAQARHGRALRRPAQGRPDDRAGRQPHPLRRDPRRRLVLLSPRRTTAARCSCSSAARSTRRRSSPTRSRWTRSDAVFRTVAAGEALKVMVDDRAGSERRTRMIGLHEELQQREASGRPVRVGLIGAGQMGTDVVATTQRHAGPARRGHRRHRPRAGPRRLPHRPGRGRGRGGGDPPRRRTPPWRPASWWPCSDFRIVTDMRSHRRHAGVHRRAGDRRPGRPALGPRPATTWP